MQNLIIGLLLAIPLPVNAQAEVVPVVEVKPLEQMTIPELIEFYSIVYNVENELVTKIIDCESGFNPTIQSNYYKDGVREKSFGLAQINLPSHPNITYEQAVNPVFAVGFLARNLSEGNGSMWRTCWNKHKS